jgi:hypothetical protein
MDLVERILVESGVDRTVPPPGWVGYFMALAEAFVEWSSGWFPGLRGLSSISTKLGPRTTLLLTAVLLLILCALLRVAVLSRRTRRAAPPPPALSPSLARTSPDRDRAAWRQEIDRRLAARDISGALEALWWWFARSVSSSHVDPSWTSRELLVCCGRGDLATFARALDRLLYGAERPGSEDLRRFLQGLEEALA